MLRDEAPDYSIKEIFVFNEDTCTMVNRIANTGGSDTTEADSSILLATQSIKTTCCKEWLKQKNFFNLSPPFRGTGGINHN
jgi:hypothetical protein